MKIIILTNAEYTALDSVIINGTKNNGYKDFGTSQDKTHFSALRKFAKPCTTLNQVEDVFYKKEIERIMKKVLTTK